MIDAFLVRTLLIASLIALVGPLSAWPLRRHAPAASPLTAPVAASPALPRRRLRLIALGVVLSLLRRRGK